MSGLEPQLSTASSAPPAPVALATFLQRAAQSWTADVRKRVHKIRRAAQDKCGPVAERVMCRVLFGKYSRISTNGAGPHPQTLRAADREFLPAALEIIESPPAPATIATLWFICAAFIATLTWSYFARLDIHAVAQGRIQPHGRSKVVQPLEAGKVSAILVENGSRVRAGDVVAELDATETAAEEEGIRNDLDASERESARRKFAIELAQKSREAHDQQFADAADLARDFSERERRVLIADLRQLQSSFNALEAQLDERRAMLNRLAMSMTARDDLIRSMKERVDTRQKLDEKNQGYRSHVIDALQEYGREVTTLAGEKGQVIETQAAIRSLERKMEQVRSEFIADQAQKLADAERKRDRFSQDLVKAHTKVGHMRLVAPIDGTVQQLAISTQGQVVSAGQALMTVVPLDNILEVEANVLNQDIGFVTSGQHAVVKIEAFPFTRYGTIEGTVAKVSREAVDERDASGLADPTATTRPQGAQPAQPRNQSLVYPAIIILDRRSIIIDGREVPLAAGMVVSVEIRTGNRRVIDYLLAPLREVTSHAMHER